MAFDVDDKFILFWFLEKIWYFFSPKDKGLGFLQIRTYNL